MHPRNQIRLLAGLTIDTSLETSKQINEAREVPRKKDGLADKSDANMRKYESNCKKAIAHLKNAVKALEAMPQMDFDAQIPNCIADIEEMVTDCLEPCLEKGSEKKEEKEEVKESVLEEGTNIFTSPQIRKVMMKVIKDYEANNLESWEQDYPKVYQEVLDHYAGTGDMPYNVMTGDEGDAGQWVVDAYMRDMKQYAADHAGEENEEEAGKDTSDMFTKGEKVLYDNGVWIVHVADAQGDMVGVIPPGMKDASKDEQAKSMQMVKYEKLRKPSKEEECEMGVSGMPLEMTESTMSQRKQEHEDLIAKSKKKQDEILGKRENKRQSVQRIEAKKNAMKEDEEQVEENMKPLDNMLKMKEVDIKNTSQLDDANDMNPEKIKVPRKIKSLLADTIKLFHADAEKVPMTGHTANEKKQFMLDTADAFQELHDMLDGDMDNFKKAQHYAQSLMGPMIHRMPTEVWDFLAHGGQKRTLADFMKEVKTK